MNCEDARTRLPDYWSHTLSDGAELELDAHLAGCESCRREAGELGGIWTQLGLIPAEQPSPALRGRFHETLAAYKQGLAEHPRRGFAQWLARWWPARPALQFALSMALLVAGLGMGVGIRPEQKHEAPEIAQLRTEVGNMRQLVALSLMQQQSATERLKGVNWSYRVEPNDTQVLAALLYTIGHDQSVNVRLAAVDALHYFSDSPVARKGAAQAVSKQTEPMVEIALIDLLVELKERSASRAIETVAADPDANPAVRERARWAVERLK